MKKKIIIISLIILTILFLIGYLYQTFALSNIITKSDNEYIVTINVEKNSCNMVIYSDRNLFTEVIYRRKLQSHYMIGGKICDSQ